MANQRDIEIIIDEEGGLTAEAFGYKGKGCADDINEILNGIGKKIKSKKKTEFKDKQKVKNSEHI
jgi:hypothetical protein